MGLARRRTNDDDAGGIRQVPQGRHREMGAGRAGRRHQNRLTPASSMAVGLLSGGAAQRLVQAVAGRFRAETGSDIDGTFGAVGAMREKLQGGAAADLVILTAALVAQLEKEGKVVHGSARAIGVVPTGIAVRTNDPPPAIEDVDAVRNALLAADRIYVPDMRQSTA